MVLPELSETMAQSTDLHAATVNDVVPKQPK